MKIHLAQTEPLPLHPTLVHPVTGEPLQAIYRTKAGRLVWPQMGGSQPLGAPAPQQGGNTPGIPVLGGGHMPPVQTGGLPPAGGQLPTQQPGQQQGQPGGQPTQIPAGQPPVSQGQPHGQQGGQPQGQPQHGQPGQPPVPGPPPGYVPPSERGFPESTPVEQMNAEQQAAFYRYHMRRNQDEIRRMQGQYGDYDQLRQERDQLRQATQTEMQRAAAEAEARGRQTGLQEAGSQIVEAYFRAAAAGRMSESAIEAQLATLNRAAFVQNGAVNQQLVYDHVNVVVGGQMGGQPAGPQQYAQPVYGQQPGQQPVFVPSTVGYGQQPQLPAGQPGYPQQQVPQGYGQQQPVPNAASFGYPQQPVPQSAPGGGWPQYAPVPQAQQPQQPQGWAAPGMPAYGQPVYRQIPDYGQGAQPTAPQSSPEAGKAKAAERHGGVTRTQQRTAGSGGGAGRPGAGQRS